MGSLRSAPSNSHRRRQQKPIASLTTTTMGKLAVANSGGKFSSFYLPEAESLPSTDPDYNPSLQTWMHLLSISTRYSFSRLRSSSISALTWSGDGPSGIRPIDRLQLALKFDIPEWFRPACSKVVSSHDPPEMEDLSELPMIYVLLLFRARELFHGHDNWTQEPSVTIYPRIAPKHSVDDIIAGQLVHLGIDSSGEHLSQCVSSVLSFCGSHLSNTAKITYRD